MLDQEWFNWAILSAICFGVYSFLYKKAVEDKADVHTIQVVIPSTVIVLSVVFIISSDSYIADDLLFVLWVAALQGVLFYFTTLTRIKAFEYDIPSHVVFPIIKSSTILIVIISALVFNESDNLTEPKRAAGIFLAVLSTYLLVPMNKRISTFSFLGLVFALAAMLSSAGASITSKYLFSISDLESSYVNILGFMLLSNFVTLILASGSMLLNKTPANAFSFTHGMKWGGIMGILNFIGFVSFLQAVKIGDLSLVASINALYILIPIILSSIIYKEKLNIMSQAAVVLSIVAIILIGL